ncbi:MAG: helix-turn-helix transcriptional regulator [Dehalococcoidia bacterium]|nr:MAG: helix-turn-helix transcriptional regulator [Dehalococcoidia bacterium]
MPFSDETEQPKVENALRERVKELNCLYGISLLAERHFHSLDNFLEELADFIPYSWQYPDVTCAKIVFKGNTYKSKTFKTSEWRQSSRIYIYSEPVGEVNIFYKEECPPADEGPFLAEERALIDSLADQIGTIATRISAELEMEEINKQLSVERKALQESNAALKAVLKRIEEEKQEVSRNIMTNIDRVIMPILYALALEMPKTQGRYLEMLKASLEEITSPFISHLSDSYRSLTPSEIAVCNMIKNGFRTKEIAQTRGVSIATINRQRESIRRKLNIANSNINLATHLQSSMWK